MKQYKLGYFAIICGSLVLSLELYGLKFVYLTERISGFPWKTAPLDYLTESNIRLAVLITVGIIVLGIVLLVKEKVSNQS